MNSCRWILLLFAFVFVDFTAEARKKKIPRWHLRMAQKQGPNACAVEEILGTNHQYWTECKYWMPRNICGRKAIIRFECCEGYERVPGEHGCTGVKPLKDILSTAEDLGATIFSQYIYEAGLAEVFRRANGVTLFVPTNAAFESITREQREMLAKSFQNPKSAILLYHMIMKRVHSNDFHPEMLVDTMHPGHKLRLNKYSSGIMTANCAPVLRKDQEATNGYVNIIDTVLVPQELKNTFDTMTEDGRFEEMSRMIRETGLANQLRGEQSHTILGPSDEVFTDMPRTRRQQLQNNPSARRVLTENHIIPHSICLSAIVDEHDITTLSGNVLRFMCNETGVYVNGSRLLGETLEGTNGVVHMIGDMIVPEQAKSIWDLTSEYGLETFSTLAKRTGLQNQLENYGDVTIFAFDDNAFKSLPTEQQEKILKTPAEARELLRFHIAQGKHTRSKITDDQKITSMDGRNSLRMRVYRKGCGVESAMINRMDIEGINGVVHIIDRVLQPPTNDMIDLLRQGGNHSIMLEALQKVRTVDPSIMDVNRWQGGTMTLFAPSDQAFRKLGKDNLRRVMGNTTYLQQIVKNHIVENMISSGSFKSQLHYNVQTKQSFIEVHKQSHGIRVNNAVVMKPDMVTKEGIVHTVDSVLLPEDYVYHRIHG